MINRAFIICTMCLLILVPKNNLLGQNNLDDYRLEPFQKSIELLSGSTTEIFAPNTFWQLSSAINLPFTFNYDGIDYNQIKVSSNGYLTFDISETYHYLTNNMQSANPKNVLAPLWDYLKVSSSGKVHYATIGSTPNRKFIVEFYHVVWGPFSSPVVDFQIVLLEGSNDIEFHFGTMGNAGFGSDGASIGIKDALGNYINAIDGSHNVAMNEIMEPPVYNYRFTTSPPPDKDVGVSDIIFNSPMFVNIPDTIKVAVKNYGSQAQENIIIAYQLGNELPVKDTLNSTLAVGEEIILSFSETCKPQESGVFAIKAWTELPGDANIFNDSLKIDNNFVVFEFELPRPTNVNGSKNGQTQNLISWSPGIFEKPIPGIWNGITNEGQNVHMVINYNSTKVDTCEIYYTINGDPMPFPLRNYSKVSISKSNTFSIYTTDEFGRMSTDVDGTFYPPDSCDGTWRAGVLVNDVYTVFSGTWNATSVMSPPQFSEYKIYRNIHPEVELKDDNLISEINDFSDTSYIDIGIDENTSYYYVITSVYDFGNSLPTNEILIGDTVEIPAFDPLPGTYENSQNITISCSTEGATIYYTTDGSDPTESDNIYFDPVEISATTILKARAFKADLNSSEIASGDYIINQVNAIPSINGNFDFSIALIYPNPFSEETKIRYQTGSYGDISILVYDVTGNIIRRLVNERKKSGEYEIIWNRTNSEGRKVPSGVYFIYMNYENNIIVRKVMVQ